jgi:23S rRNA (cytidine1920-2'-O)/16S rRNA (cytidine1409-2'-O)-methyltransferase
MQNKIRLDLLLVERGFFPSREQARAAIMAGIVMVNEQKAEKAGSQFPPDATIRLLGERLPYVSRGGLKMAKAIECFALDLNNKIVLDIGASTGGFVDCALQNGATKVYAVDVGYNQLAWKLRQDERVIVLEKTNARYLDESIIPEQVDMITADVSFISLTLALPAAIDKLLKPQGELVVLIKPQFEAGREKVGKKGLVRDAAVHLEVIERIMQACEVWQIGVQGLDYSPITGQDGNIEYLLYGRKNCPTVAIDMAKVVEQAWHEHAGLVISG